MARIIKDHPRDPSLPSILTPAQLLTSVQQIRAQIIANAHRIPKFRIVADRLGSIETLLIESTVQPENPLQGKLPLPR